MLCILFNKVFTNILSEKISCKKEYSSFLSLYVKMHPKMVAFMFFAYILKLQVGFFFCFLFIFSNFSCTFIICKL